MGACLRAGYWSAGIDGAGVGRRRAGDLLGAFCAGGGVMAGRLMFVHMHDCKDPPSGAKYVSGEYGLPGWEIPDYAPRAEDYAWIARNLGDVPMRIIDAQWKPSVTTVTLIPVESLGRES